MWTALLKRLAIVLLAAAFLGGTLPQVVPTTPCSMMGGSMQDMAGMDMPSPAENGGTPHKTPFDCPQVVTCMAAQVLAVSDPPSIAVAFEWTPLTYPETNVALSGRTVQPDLFPPIALV